MLQIFFKEVKTTTIYRRAILLPRAILLAPTVCKRSLQIFYSVQKVQKIFLEYRTTVYLRPGGCYFDHLVTCRESRAIPCAVRFLTLKKVETNPQILLKILVVLKWQKSDLF